MKVKSHSRVRLPATRWTAAHQAPGPSAALSKSHAPHSGDLVRFPVSLPASLAGLQVGWEGVWAPSAG